MVVSKLDEKMLSEVAQITGGAYVRSTKQSIGLDEIVKSINEMEQTELSMMRFEEFNEQYQYLLIAALVLLLAEFLLLDRSGGGFPAPPPPQPAAGAPQHFPREVTGGFACAQRQPDCRDKRRTRTQRNKDERKNKPEQRRKGTRTSAKINRDKNARVRGRAQG